MKLKETEIMYLKERATNEISRKKLVEKDLEIMQRGYETQMSKSNELNETMLHLKNEKDERI